MTRIIIALAMFFASGLTYAQDIGGGVIGQDTSGTSHFWIPSNPLSIVISSGNVLVTIKPDGTIEYGKDYTPDAAAKAFWNAVLIERKARNCQ